MKLNIFKAAVIVILAVWISFSATGDRRFAPARILPRGAVAYVETENLPELISLWNGSDLRKRYLESDNFDDVSKSHLGIKLASRWREFGDAAGFQFDLDAVASLAEGQAAVALYDIGK